MEHPSVFREPGWRSQRHLLNPSRLKEYELHAVGLGFLNRVNPFSNHLEIFTPFDQLADSSLNELAPKTTLSLVRKEISDEEHSLLARHGFKLVKTWGTLILDISTLDISAFDSTTQKNIRKGEARLQFESMHSVPLFREYYNLFKESRKILGFRTPSFSAFLKVFSNPFYEVFVARDKVSGAVVAGLGTIRNATYLFETNSARDRTSFFANDYLKWKIIETCRARGIRAYDFAGCNPHPEPGSKDESIRKYKEKWGGTFYHQYVFRR